MWNTHGLKTNTLVIYFLFQCHAYPLIVSIKHSGNIFFFSVPRVAPFCFNQTHFFFFQCCVNLIVSIYLKYWVDSYRKTFKAERRRITLLVTEYLVRDWTRTRRNKVPGTMPCPSTWLEFSLLMPCLGIVIGFLRTRDKVTGAFVPCLSTWLDSYSYSWQSTWYIRALPVDVIEILLVLVVTEYLVHSYS